MLTTFTNRARMTTATTGAGTITLGSALAGYLSFAEAGVANGATVSYCIEDSNNIEFGHGVYTASGTTLTRNVIASKIHGEAIDNTPISLSGSARVFLTLLAEDIRNLTGPYFNVQEFGATGDGTADDSAAIQAALDAAAAGSQKRVYVPHTANGYAIGSTLTIDEGVTLFGDNLWGQERSRIKPRPGFSSPLLRTEDYGVTRKLRVGIVGLFFDGSSTTLTAIQANIQESLIQNCTIKNCFTYGIHFGGISSGPTAQALNNHILDNYLAGQIGVTEFFNGIFIDYFSADNTIERNYIEASKDAGIRSRGYNNKITNNHIYSVAGTGGGVGAGIYTETSADHDISQNYVELCAAEGVIMQGGGSDVATLAACVHGNVFRNIDTGNTSNGVIEIAGSDVSAVSVSGNVVRRDAATSYATPYFVYFNGITPARAKVFGNEWQTGLIATAETNISASIASVKDFGAVADGVADDRNAFEAAAASSNGVVLVPRGTYLIGSATSTRVLWLLLDATITGLSALGDGQTPTVTIDNTSRLAGTVLKLQDLQYGNAMHIGDPDPWMEQFIRPSAQSRATLVAMSPDGQIGLTAATKTSDNPGTAGTQLAGVAGNFYAVNDYVGDRVGYGGYFEGWRRPSAGQTLAFEADIVNEDATVSFNPGSPLSPSSAYTFGALINSGGGRSGTHTLFPASVGLAFGANGSTFERGIVFNSGALSGSEAISVPITYQMAWYAGTTKTSFIDQATHQRLVQDNSVNPVESNKRQRASGAATQSVDVIFEENSFGCSGSSADYLGVQTRVLQRSNFSGGNARFSYDIVAKNTDGTSSQVSLNGLANKSFAPATNNDIALGDASFRWSTGYFANLNTSGAITENGINHWTPVRKTADQTKSSTTALANDTALQFAMAANTKYAIRGRVHYGTPGGGDIKFRHTGPASPTFVHIKRNSLAPGATALGNIAIDSAYSSADIVITETSGTEGYFEFDGVVHNGANAGTFAIQWAQNTSDAGSTIVRAGSYIEYATT